MSLRRSICLSLAVNVALLGAWLAAGKSPRTPLLTSSARRTALSNAREPAPSVTATATAGPRPTPPSLRWERLSSEDLRTYRDNLIAAGCPKATVRDIMRAVINERFDRRRQQLLQPFSDRYWDMLAAGGKAFDGIRTDLATMKEERGSVLKEILGDESPDPEQERARRVEDWTAAWNWLPPSKVQQMLSIEEKYQALREKLEAEMKLRPDSAQTAGQAAKDQTALKKLEEQLGTERDALLTAEEREEFRLRQSGAPEWAENLRGFEPDEQELRAVARLTLEANHLSEGELQSKIKGALGEERYTQYTRARDADFGSLTRVVERYGLPVDAAVQAFDARNAALAAAGQIKQNPDLSEPERRIALEAIQLETERALTQALGAEVLATYRSHGGEWVAGLVTGTDGRKPREHR